MTETLKTKRKFIIGSEWLSYKIYTGTQTADDFIKQQLPELISGLKRDNCIDNWFFIRYADPDLHLRLRFRLKHGDKLNDVVTKLHGILEPLVVDRLIHKVVVDTYSRELERYGLLTIGESEDLFTLNSQMIIQLLKAANNDENKRWLWGIKAMDILLNGFGYTLKEKRDLLFEMKTDFANEFGMNKNIRKQLSMKFRAYRADISKLLDPECQNETDLTFRGYQDKYKRISTKIMSADGMKENELNRDYLMYSYIHMHCNRLFSSKQRMNEWVLYDILYQHYYSTYARNEKQIKTMKIAI